MRTYLFLSDSWRKNSVDVNERQLVLIKNEIAPLHAMQLYQNKIMINFCLYKTLLSTAKVPMQQRYNRSEAEEEGKDPFRGSAGCYNIVYACTYTSVPVYNMYTKCVCVGGFCMHSTFCDDSAFFLNTGLCF